MKMMRAFRRIKNSSKGLVVLTITESSCKCTVSNPSVSSDCNTPEPLLSE